jgi:hypothetical protein
LELLQEQLFYKEKFMKLAKIVGVILAFYSFYGHGVRHSDEEMRVLIDDVDPNKWSNKWLADDDRDDPNYCLKLLRHGPYQSIKDREVLIERGYSKGLYSVAIRDELKNKRLYPLISLDDQDNLYVAYVCC